jgi:O-antigen ligase
MSILHRTFLIYLRIAWQTALQLSFFLLCIRFQVAAFRSAGPDLAPLIILISGCLAAGVMMPKFAAVAFTAAVPTLTGLDQIGVLTFPSSVSLAFTALWIGFSVEKVYRIRNTSLAFLNPLIRTSQLPVALRSGVSREVQAAREQNETSQLSKRPIDRYPAFSLIAIDILITALLLSLSYQLWVGRTFIDLKSIFFNVASVGFGNPFYFLSAAFVWLQGLFFYRLMYSTQTEELRGDPSLPDESLFTLRSGRMIIIIWCISIFAFFLVQYLWHIPEGWVSAGFQSPFEDISSFGSFAVTVLVFFFVTIYIVPRRSFFINLIGGLIMLGMVILSWSRGTWLAAIVFLLLVALIRLPRRGSVVLITFVVISFAAINATSGRQFWVQQVYRERLVALVRLENPTAKSLERFSLYRKAIRMIQERPFAGHGIGSFYLKSMSYAVPGDRYETGPNFAHNVFLQIASEQGIFVAALFAFLVASVFYRAFGIWLACGESQCRHRDVTLLIIGYPVSLAAYLETQMTANSLNIYVSNQYLFWFLVATILSLAKNKCGLNSALMQLPDSSIGNRMNSALRTTQR